MHNEHINTGGRIMTKTEILLVMGSSTVIGLMVVIATLLGIYIFAVTHSALVVATLISPVVILAIGFGIILGMDVVDYIA